MLKPALRACCWLAAAVAYGATAATIATNTPTSPLPGQDLFSNSAVRRIRIEIAPKELAELRQNSRQYVPALVQEGTNTFEKAGIHLKGSTGSFRSLDDKPGLTLNFARFVRGQKFHGLQKIHLNNSVEDPSYLNEMLGGELFRAAGVPAPRVTHAIVELNGRRLGLYVLKEGFTRDFLSLHFRETEGKFYDRDLDQNAGVEELKALAAAARQPDLQERWKQFERLLDLPRVVSFMALEVMACHRDGYCLARNNFRLYHHRQSDKFLFFPHGMDQLFGKADAPIRPQMNGIIARALMETPEGRQFYQQRFSSLLTNVFDAQAMSRRADQMLAMLEPVIGGPSEKRDLEQAVEQVKERIIRRRADLQKQLAEPELLPLSFDAGVARLRGWQPVDPPMSGIMEEATGPNGKAALRIRAGPVTSSSWRMKVLLRKGKYRFEGAVCTKGVEPLGFGKNNGASLRVLGAQGLARANLTGDQNWKEVQVEFLVAAPEQEMQLSCELRGRSGEAWFDVESLRLVWLEER